MCFLREEEIEKNFTVVPNFAPVSFVGLKITVGRQIALPLFFEMI